MTNKELLYVEDALGHEQFMEKSCKLASSQIKDQNLSNCLEDFERIHLELQNKFINLL